jgi:transcriptional regulator with XRE-family HTH domain
MAESNEERQFNEALIARTKEWRVEMGWTAEQMAVALGVPADRYRKYEIRSPLPAYLMQRFCLVTNADIENFLFGKPRQRQARTPLVTKSQNRR